MIDELQHARGKKALHVSQGNGNSPPPEGSVYFAMHVAGFATQAESDGHFVGGPGGAPPPPGGSGEVPATPEPSTVLLCGIGIGCLALRQFASWRRRSVA